MGRNSSATMIRQKSIAPIGVLFSVLAWSTSAPATETWNCTTTRTNANPHVKVYPQTAQIEINGDDLAQTELNPAISVPTTHLHVLVNNEIGIVAVSAQAITNKQWATVSGLPSKMASALQAEINSAIPNPLVNSYTLALNKQDGSMRIGSVGTTAVSEFGTGKCQLSPAPTDLQTQK
jgi:ABC-type lipoprotein release transport system permease subunit